MAVLILDSSMTGSSLMGWSNALHTHFPDDPDAEYEMLERQVLCGRGGGACSTTQIQPASCVARKRSEGRTIAALHAPGNARTQHVDNSIVRSVCVLAASCTRQLLGQCMPRYVIGTVHVGCCSMCACTVCSKRLQSCNPPEPVST
jgi:hypothetical protein